MNRGTLNREYTHREVLVVIAGLASGMFLAALDQTIVSTALPIITADLNGATHYSWVVTAYLLASTISTPLYGKIGDLYGRKTVYVASILIFLVGSMLCGAAQNLPELIVFRAIQGAEAGGLMTLAFAIIGDVVSPRERGRYQGYFGAVFGLSSVLGPLIGGGLTESISWRWIFYVNVPIGLIALFIVVTKLHLPKKRTDHKVDFLGAGFIASGVSALLLAMVWGGGSPDAASGFTGYPWGSPEILGLLAIGVLSTVAFLWQESRHNEPIIPLVLFRDSVFSVSTALSFVSGAVLFGAVVYIPQYQQLVRGYSPVESGLLMIPLMVGIVTGAIGSGRLTSQLGRYRVFPIVGTALMMLGFILFSFVAVDTPQPMIAIWMIVLGIGVGLFMQVTTLAVQNSVDNQHMGAATAAVTFFRTLGGAFGTSIFGAILLNRVSFELERTLPQGTVLDLDALGPENVPPAGAVQDAVFDAFAHGLHVVFLWGIPLTVLAFGLALMLKDKPLRDHSAVTVPVAE